MTYKRLEDSKFAWPRVRDGVKAVELLQDHLFTPEVKRHLRKMKAAPQIGAVELMIAANTITAAHADALLKATPLEQRTDY